MLMSISTGSLAPLPLRTIFRCAPKPAATVWSWWRPGLPRMRDGRRLYAMEREFRLPVTHRPPDTGAPSAAGDVVRLDFNCG